MAVSISVYTIWHCLATYEMIVGNVNGKFVFLECLSRDSHLQFSVANQTKLIFCGVGCGVVILKVLEQDRKKTLDVNFMFC